MKHAIAALLAVAAPVAMLASAPAAQTASNLPKPLGVFQDWTAASYGSGADIACYAFTTTDAKPPKKQSNAYVPVGTHKKKAKPKPKVTTPPGMLTVTERPTFRDEISLSQGMTYTKHAKVVLAVGTTNLKFFTKDNMAYAMNGAATTKAFLAGSTVTATANAKNAKPVTDSFSLDGFTAAYKAIEKACPVSAKTPAATKTPKTTKTPGAAASKSKSS